MSQVSVDQSFVYANGQTEARPAHDDPPLRISERVLVTPFNAVQYTRRRRRWLQEQLGVPVRIRSRRVGWRGACEHEAAHAVVALLGGGAVAYAAVFTTGPKAHDVGGTVAVCGASPAVALAVAVAGSVQNRVRWLGLVDAELTWEAVAGIPNRMLTVPRTLTVARQYVRKLLTNHHLIVRALADALGRWLLLDDRDICRLILDDDIIWRRDSPVACAFYRGCIAVARCVHGLSRSEKRTLRAGLERLVRS